ncbi:hypothetical protein ACM66B_006660 [Microbotryomycetes sp. NB124-2]
MLSHSSGARRDAPPSTPATTRGISPPSKSATQSQQRLPAAQAAAPATSTLGRVAVPRACITVHARHATLITEKALKHKIVLVLPAIGMSAGPLSPLKQGFLTWTGSEHVDPSTFNQWLASFTGRDNERTSSLVTLQSPQQARLDVAQNSSPSDKAETDPQTDIQPPRATPKLEARLFKSVVSFHFDPDPALNATSEPGQPSSARDLANAFAPGVVEVGTSEVNVLVSLIEKPPRVASLSKVYDVAVDLALECYSHAWPLLSHASGRLNGDNSWVRKYMCDPYDSAATFSTQKTNAKWSGTAELGTSGASVSASRESASRVHTSEQTIPAQPRARPIPAGGADIMIASPDITDPSLLRDFDVSFGYKVTLSPTVSFIAKKVARKVVSGKVQVMEPTDPHYEQYTDETTGQLRKRKRAMPQGLSKRDERILRSVRRRAHYLDKGMNLCGFRVGWTFWLGLIPLAGDIASMLLGYTLVLRKCRQAELPVMLSQRMAFNQAVAFGIGLVPFVGDLLAAVWKANSRNAALLEAFLIERAKKQSSGNPTVENAGVQHVIDSSRIDRMTGEPTGTGTYTPPPGGVSQPTGASAVSAGAGRTPARGRSWYGWGGAKRDTKQGSGHVDETQPLTSQSAQQPVSSGVSPAVPRR